MATWYRLRPVGHRSWLARALTAASNPVDSTHANHRPVASRRPRSTVRVVPNRTMSTAARTSLRGSPRLAGEVVPGPAGMMPRGRPRRSGDVDADVCHAVAADTTATPSSSRGAFRSICRSSELADSAITTRTSTPARAAAVPSHVPSGRRGREPEVGLTATSQDASRCQSRRSASVRGSIARRSPRWGGLVVGEVGVPQLPWRRAAASVVEQADRRTHRG